MEENKTNAVATATKGEQIVALMKQADQMYLLENAQAIDNAASVVQALSSILTDDYMKDKIMPLMNRNIGFLTDRDPHKGQVPYSMAVVRDCCIDCMLEGVTPIKNHMNIIAGRAYITKEGFTELLGKLSKYDKYQLKYIFMFDSEKTNVSQQDFEAIPCVIKYSLRGEEQEPFKYTAIVNKRGQGSMDMIRGKAERKCKKAFYEYLTGIDLGEGDVTEDIGYTEVSSTTNTMKDAIATKMQNKSKSAIQPTEEDWDKVEQESKDDAADMLKAMFDNNGK